MRLDRVLRILGYTLLLFVAIAWAGSYAFADSGSSSGSVAGFDWKTIVGTVAGLLGIGGLIDRVKAKAAQWEKQVLDAAAREARNVAEAVQKKLVGGTSAFTEWLSRLEAWVTKQGGKLPAPLRDKAVTAAHQVFHELHLYTDPLQEASVRFEDALTSFEKQLPELQRQIATFSIVKPPAPATPPAPPPAPPPLPPAAA